MEQRPARILPVIIASQFAGTSLWFAGNAVLADLQRDRSDPDFVIIARSDACREQGFQEAVKRVNRAADVGADMGLIFPRAPAEAIRTPKVCKLPMIYVQSTRHPRRPPAV